MKIPNITAADNGGKEFKKLPPGAHFAICNMMVDCGMQPGFQGKPQRKVYIRWEVPDERVTYEKDGVQHEGPCSIGKFYTLSLSEKATLRKDLENWRGRTFIEDVGPTLLKNHGSQTSEGIRIEATPTARPLRSANRIGVQSAVSTPSAIPGRRVTIASASGGSCTSQVDSTITTSGLWD